MMESILGMLIGAGLFIGGFSLHDMDYREGAQTATQTASDGTAYLINDDHLHSKRENWAYLMGPVGAAIFALSAKHAWDQREKRRAAVSMHLNQTFQQFRVRLGQDRSSRMGASGFRLQHLSKATQTAPFPSLFASGHMVASDIHVALAPSALIFFHRNAKRTVAQNSTLWRIKP